MINKFKYRRSGLLTNPTKLESVIMDIIAKMNEIIDVLNSIPDVCKTEHFSQIVELQAQFDKLQKSIPQMKTPQHDSDMILLGRVMNDSGM